MPQTSSTIFVAKKTTITYGVFEYFFFPIIIKRFPWLLDVDPPG
jgi:hypothetical protein